jgi:hypothetical protein
VDICTYNEKSFIIYSIGGKKARQNIYGVSELTLPYFLIKAPYPLATPCLEAAT